MKDWKKCVIIVIAEENFTIRNEIQGRLSHKENSLDDLRIESYFITILVNFCFICYWTGLVKPFFSWMDSVTRDSLDAILDDMWPG